MEKIEIENEKELIKNDNLIINKETNLQSDTGIIKTESFKSEFKLPENELDDTYLKVIQLLENQHKIEIVKLEVNIYFIIA